MSTDLSQFDGLSLPEKLQILEDLWDRIAASPEALPVPEWQKVELDRRIKHLEENPGCLIPWEEVKRQLRGENTRDALIHSSSAR